MLMSTVRDYPRLPHKWARPLPQREYTQCGRLCTGGNGVLLGEDIQRLFEHAWGVGNKGDLVWMAILSVRRIAAVVYSWRKRLMARFRRG